jgi:dipeptidyl aminopeptidase/acylaminoacyl peptidase
MAAGVALVSLTLIAGLLAGALPRPPFLEVVPPVETASPTAVASTSAVPDTSPAPTPNLAPTPSAGAPVTPVPVENGPLIVYAITSRAVDVFTLDPVSGDRVELGTLQNRTGPAGQSIHRSTDRRSAVVFGVGDSIVAAIDVASRSIAPVRLPADGRRDAISPSGDLVARLVEEGDRIVVSVVNLAGEQVHRSAALPQGAIPLDAITWWPDETALLANTCCVGSPEQGRLFRVPVDGSPVQELAEGNGYFGSMRWSPDGSTVAFTNAECPEACTRGIGTFRLADGRLTQLTETGDQAPEWSPDGSRIAVARGFGSPDPGIYLIYADGSDLTRLSTGSDGITDGDRDPFWSPDGKWVIFSRGPYDASLGDLYIVPATGGEPRLLLQNAVADW